MRIYRDARMVNHLLRKGFLSELEGYLSELTGKPKIKLGKRDQQLLNQLIYKPEHISSLLRHVNELYEGIPPPDGDTKKRINGKHVTHFLITGPMSEQATRKAIKKLRRYELIKLINQSLEDNTLAQDLENWNLTKKIVAANENRAEFFDITEYGLFCFLSQAQMLDFEPSMFGRCWESKMVKLLLSPYFEKETVASHLTMQEFIVIKDFLQEALHIVKQRLSIIEESDEIDIFKHETLNVRKKVTGYRIWKEELIAKLEGDLLWHARSFALRLMADTASKDKDKTKNSRDKLNFLLHDEKFVKLVKDTMSEILSYYGGDKLLEMDKTLHP